MSNKNKTKENNPIFTFICFSARIIGPRLLSSILHSRGYESNLFFLTSGVHQYTSDLSPQIEQSLIHLLDKRKTNIVGISLMSSYFQLAKRITERIQNELEIPVIWGGVHPTIQSEDCIQVADMICIGEGEEAIVELADTLTKKKPLHTIPNIWLKRDGQISRNPTRPLFKNLDHLPFPDYGDSNKYYLHKGEFHQGDPLPPRFPEYEIMSSRGCPYHCSYCISSRIKELYPQEKSLIRQRSPANIIDEIVKAREYFSHLQQIRFQDEVFSWNPNWISEFCRLYKDKIKLPFTCTFHPNVVKKEIVALLKEAGLESVGFGVQSASQKIRYETFTRPVSDQTLISSARILHDYKVDLYCDIIMNNPYETEEDRKEGLNFLLNFPRPYNWSMFFLRFYPYTTITDQALKDGIISEDDIEGIGKQTHTNIADPKSNLKKSEIFWYYILLLASKRFIPRKAIEWIGKSNVFKKFPFLLKPFVIFSHFINMSIIGFKKICRGRISYALLKVYVRQALTPRN